MFTNKTLCLVAAVSLGAVSLVLAQQDSAGPAPKERRMRQGEFGPPAFPLLEILDANQDGRLSRDEIAAAATALKKLDKDHDGKLSADEIGWPPRRFGGRGFPGGPGFPGSPGFPGGPGGFGFPGGPGGESSGLSLAQRILARDADGDGKVTAAELPPSMQFLLRRADANQDGALEADEAERAGR